MHVVYNVVRERRLAKGLCRIVSAAMIELDSIEAFELFRFYRENPEGVLQRVHFITIESKWCTPPWEFQEGCLKNAEGFLRIWTFLERFRPLGGPACPVSLPASACGQEIDRDIDWCCLSVLFECSILLQHVHSDQSDTRKQEAQSLNMSQCKICFLQRRPESRWVLQDGWLGFSNWKVVSSLRYQHANSVQVYSQASALLDVLFFACLT